MTDNNAEICANCLTSEHPIDVRGIRVLQSGAEIKYLICYSCCTILRRFHFNDEPTKMKHFWNQIWQNLSLEECMESIEERAPQKQESETEEAEEIAAVAV